MSDFGASPDAQIVQLRDMLTVAIDHTIYDADRTRGDAVASLQLMRALVERLIEQYPVLTAQARGDA